MFNFLNNTSPSEIKQTQPEPTTLVTDVSSSLVTDASSTNISESSITSMPDDTVSYDFSTPMNNITSPEISLSRIPENQDFSYLQDKLPRLFGFCMKTQNANYKIHLCVYSINEECVINYKPVPFLQFLLCKPGPDQKWGFPSFEYVCPVLNDVTEPVTNVEYEYDDSITPEQTHFENECFTNLLGILRTNINFHTTENNDIMKQMYQGFIEYDENNIIVVYNFTNNLGLIQIDVNPPAVTNAQPSLTENQPRFVWKIIDEMLYKKQQDNDDMIVPFFNKYDYMKNIKSLNGDIIPYPFSLYLCSYGENNNIVNVVKDRDLETNLEQIHPFLKNGVLFSTNPIQPGNANITKCAVFIHNCLYLLQDITEIDDETKQSYINKVISSSTFYFHENKLQLWGIKDILQFVEM